MFNISIASQSFQSAESQDFLATLLASLPSLSESNAAELADDMLDRAVSYDASQPSFAADLRAAVVSAEEAESVA